MLPTRSYPAKILLFGEYSVILGSEALALPYPKLEGRWVKGGHQEYNLRPFVEFLSSRNDFDSDAFTQLLQEGWTYESSIPVGYGLGSSGAFTAAVFDAFYTGSSVELSDQRKVMAELESFFHGASSGTDPLISYLEKGVFLTGKEHLEVLESYPDIPDSETAFLIDTQIPRSTAPLVEQFLASCEEEAFKKRIAEELNPLVGKGVQAFLSGDANSIGEAWQGISKLQWELFQPMIPDVYKTIWEEGLATDQYYLKLCGAGGGGFLLGLSPKGIKSQEWLSEHIPGYQSLSLASQ